MTPEEQHRQNFSNIAQENADMLREAAASGEIDVTKLPGHVQRGLIDEGVFPEEAFTEVEQTRQPFMPKAPVTPKMESVGKSVKMRDKQTRVDNTVLGVGLAAMARGDDVTTAIATAVNEGALDYDKEILEAGKQAMLEDNKAIVEDRALSINPATDPEEVQAELEALSEWERESAEQAAATEMLFYGSIVNPDVAEEVVKKRAVKMHLGRMGQEVIGEMGFWDWARNIGNLFVPFAQMVDNHDLTDDFLDAVSPEEFLANFKNKWDSLSAEEQEALLPALDEELQEMPELQRAELFEYLSGSSDNPEAWGSFGNAQTAFNAAEVVIAALSLVRGVVGAYKGTRIVKEMHELGRVEEAAEMTAAATRSGTDEALRAIQMDVPEVVEILSPLRPVNPDTPNLAGLDTRVVKEILKYEAKTVDFTEDARDGVLFIREGFLTDKEKAIGAANIEKNFAQKRGITDVVVESKDDRWVVSYTKTDHKGNPLPNQREEIMYRVDKDTQEMEFRDPGILGKVFGSPLAWANKDLMAEVRRNIRLDAAQARVFEQLRQLHLESIQPILGKGVKGAFNTLSPVVRKRLQKVNDVLLSGDAQEKVYTVKELRDGVAGHKLDDAEIETYFKTRRLYDTLYDLRNDQLKLTLQARGMMHVNMPNALTDFGYTLGRPLRNYGDARNSIMQSKAKYYYDEAAGELKSFGFEVNNLNKLDSGDFSEFTDVVGLYDDGKRFVKLDKPQDLDGSGVKVRYALVDAEEIKPLPHRVLHKVEGYVPKINDQAAWFVKVRERTNIDGTTTAANKTVGNVGVRTIRAFSNRAEAEKWAEAETRRLREAGIPPEQQTIIVNADRQIEQERLIGSLDEPSAYAGGGLYTGARSSREIPWGAEGLIQPRVNAFEAIERNMASVAKYVSRNEARLGMEERAVKTANMLLNRDAFTSDKKFTTFEELSTVTADTEAGRKIRALYHQINDWNAMPTAAERYTKGLVQGIIDSSFGQKLPGFATKGLHSLKSTDPIGAARAAAFHGLLGWFNPVQMWVQAQGAAVAISMNILNPAELGRVMRMQFGIQAMQYVQRTPANLAHTAKAIGMSTEEFTELMRIWDKSGLAESLLQTADHAAAARGHGYVLTALSRASDKGLWFYRAGEMFNRRLSFITAYRRALAKSQEQGMTNTDLGIGRLADGKWSISDKAAKELLDDTNNLMLNLSKANRAEWQKGVLSLFTQFAQVNSKTVETILGVNGNLTGAERGRLIAGQVALYGAAGIPVANLGASWALEMFGYEDSYELEKELGPGAVKAINEGMLGWLTLAVFGADLEIGDRSALLGGVGRFIDDLVFAEGTVSDKLFGAFGNVQSRFWEGVFGKYEPISLGVAENRAINVATAILNPLLSSVSTFRNIDKAIFMNRFHRIVDKHYGTVIGPRDFSLMEEIGVAFGYRLTDEVEVYNVMQRNKADAAFRKKITAEIVKLTHQYSIQSQYDGGLSDEQLNQYREAIAVFYQLFDSHEQSLVRKAVQDKLTNGKSKESKEWLEYRKNNQEGLTNQLWDMREGVFANMHRVLGSGGIVSQGVYNNEEEE